MGSPSSCSTKNLSEFHNHFSPLTMVSILHHASLQAAGIVLLAHHLNLGPPWGKLHPVSPGSYCCCNTKPSWSKLRSKDCVRWALDIVWVVCTAWQYKATTYNSNLRLRLAERARAWAIAPTKFFFPTGAGFLPALFRTNYMALLCCMGIVHDSCARTGNTFQNAFQINCLI